MKIAIIGSRSWKHKAKIQSYINSLPDDTTIVSGGAIGVDSIAEEAAKSRGLKTEIYKPEYDKYDGKIAPLIRNEQIVNACDKLTAFYDGFSSGTRYTVNLAKKQNKPVEIIEYEWLDFIKEEKKKDYYTKLAEFLREESKAHTIYPPKEQIFSAFNYCNPNQIRSVILGQDCYINENQAHGLSFSVPPGEKIPPSLVNIFKELKSDLGIENKTGHLEPWAKQGVLLLNSVLTVRKGESGSHAKRGWEVFTDNAIKLLNNNVKPIVFILMGNYAKSKADLISNTHHLVLQTGHPSPLSIKLFLGCKIFSKTNEFLSNNESIPINWKL